MIYLLVLLVVLLFGVVLLVGAPYLPTLHSQTEQAIQLLDLSPGSTVIELGSGDGRVARRFAMQGYKVVGYELNPLLVFVSYIVTWKYRRDIKIIWGDYWQKTWPKADGVYVFLLDRFMPKLDHAAQNYSNRHGQLKLVSYAFQIPNKKPNKSRSGLFLYLYK